MSDGAEAGFEAAIDDNELKPGHLKRCTVGSEDILLCRLASGQVYAIRNRCSHMNQPLHEGRLIGHRISCPMHGAEFDVRSGKALSFPASRPIVRFEARTDGGRILVSRTPAPAPALGGPISS